VNPEHGVDDDRCVKVISCGRTDIGQKRPHNEDSIGIFDEYGIYIVADGMGGHAAGEVASSAAVDTLKEFILQTRMDQDFTWPFGMNAEKTVSENILDTGIQLANRKVCSLAETNPDYTGMGTTLAVILVADSRVLIGHVGDSRVYKYRDGNLALMTHDHSWVNEQLQKNILTEDEAKNHRWKNIITRALGNRLDLQVDIRKLEFDPGDLFILCSDGLTGMVEDEGIKSILDRSNGNLETTTEELIAAANAAGGQDNISVVLIRFLS
jgi:serine/threonine protein phosphatase PrpC